MAIRAPDGANKGSPRLHKLTTPQSEKFSKWEKKSPLCRGSLKTTKQARLQSQQSLTIGTTGDKCLKPQTCDFQKKNNIATDAEFVTNGTRIRVFLRAIAKKYPFCEICRIQARVFTKHLE